jgi:hypothetical protein
MSSNWTILLLYGFTFPKEMSRRKLYIWYGNQKYLGLELYICKLSVNSLEFTPQKCWKSIEENVCIIIREFLETAFISK